MLQVNSVDKRGLQLYRHLSIVNHQLLVFVYQSDNSSTGSTDGSVVEFSPATREARVRFPVSATFFFPPETFFATKVVFILLFFFCLLFVFACFCMFGSWCLNYFYFGYFHFFGSKSVAYHWKQVAVTFSC